MTLRHTSAFSRRSAPEVCQSFRPENRRGRRKRRGHDGPAARVQKSAHGGHHRSTGYTRRFLRNGFNGLFRALPGDEFLLSPSSVDFLCAQFRLDLRRIHELDTSNGCQDHTALPSAAAFANRTRRHVHIRRGIDEGGDNAARLRAADRSRV
jgi:hypothetical protein